MRLYLDDERHPRGEGYTVVRSGESFREAIKTGVVTFISFDHDLGADEPTGHELARWLVEYDLDHDALGEDFGFHVHSANPVGARNIYELLTLHRLQARQKPVTVLEM